MQVRFKGSTLKRVSQCGTSSNIDVHILYYFCSYRDIVVKGPKTFK